MAMGYGILISSVKEQVPKITVLSIVFMASNVAYLIALQINKASPIPPHIQMYVSLPLSLTNTIFFYWILYSLGTTRRVLRENHQLIKLRIMTIFTVILAVAYCISVFAMGVELFVKFTGERDILWH